MIFIYQNILVGILVSDEAFYNEDEIEDVDGVKRSISSKSPVEWIEEESYFFRLSKWEKPLLDYYEKSSKFYSSENLEKMKLLVLLKVD